MGARPHRNNRGERRRRRRGIVVEVEESPASDLLVLDTGHLVPIVFVVDGPTDGVVTVDTPDGLFELLDGGPD